MGSMVVGTAGGDTSWSLSGASPTAALKTAGGIFECLLSTREQLERELGGGGTLTERLHRWFQLDLQQLEPSKALVRGWMLESANPLFPSAMLQGPLLQGPLLQGPLVLRYAAQVQSEFELARTRGEISQWIAPLVAAGTFIALRGSLVLSWLGDDSPRAAHTLALARAEIEAFVRLLAPWPGLEDASPSSSRSGGVAGPRALASPIEPRSLPSGSGSTPMPLPSLEGQAAIEAVQTSSAQIEAAQIEAAQTAAAQTTAEQTAAETAAVSSTIAHVPPVVLGTLAQMPPAPEPSGSEPGMPARAMEPARSDSSVPPPAKAGNGKPGAHSKRKSRSKNAKR